MAVGDRIKRARNLRGMTQKELGIAIGFEEKSFRYRLLDEFLKEWQLRKKQLREGEITKEEYLEWKLNWPQTADGCGRYEPKKKWRKE